MRSPRVITELKSGAKCLLRIIACEYEKEEEG
jgi:hypothetical protein